MHRSRSHVCPTPEELRAEMPRWPLATMAWTPAQARCRADLAAGKLVNVFSGANYSAKTYFAVATALRAAAGMEPWCPTPANVNLCSLSLAQGRQAFQEYLHEFLYPPDGRPGLGRCVHNSTKREGLYSVLELCNGSRVDLMTVAQGAHLHQGGRVSLRVFDEEPSYDVFEESLFRFRRGMQGRVLFTMTPTKGRSWVADELLDRRDELNIGAVTAALWENCIFVCAHCDRPDAGAVRAGAAACECREPAWTIPSCPACGRDRAWWDAKLDRLGLTRDPDRDHRAAHDWMQLQLAATQDVAVREEGGACGRCWTFGVYPRPDPSEVRNKLLIVQDPRRIAMRFLGWWEELDGQSCLRRAQVKALRAYATTVERAEGPLRVWEAPKPGSPYVLGVDMAQGIGEDEIAMQVVNAATGHQAACWAANDVPWAETLPECVDLAREYQNATICPERASTGEALIDYLKGIPGLSLYHYRSPDRHIRSVLADRVGFHPGARNSDRIRQNLLRAVIAGLEEQPDGTWKVVPGRTDACYLRDLTTVEQLGRWFYDVKKDGRIACAEHLHDDRADALALAWECRTHPFVSRTARPARDLLQSGAQGTRWAAYRRQLRRWPHSDR